MNQQSIVCYSSDDSDTEQFDHESIDEIIIQDIIDCLLDKIQQYDRHNFRFHRKQPMHYDSDDSDDSNNDDVNDDTAHDDHHSSWSTTDDSDDDDDTLKDGVCKTKGELTFDDLPKIERLQIQSPIEQLTQIGNVSSIVNQLVVVQSFSTEHVLDLDSTLFFKSGSYLGQIFDVIGPVQQPNYVIRFNSINEIHELNIKINMPVYYNSCFPEPYTRYVFVNNLLRQKGCDASWKHNNEPPPEHQDYSDDEQERIAKWKLHAKSRPIS